MTQVTITFSVDETKIDFEHMDRAVLDALFLPDPVTQAEFDLVDKLIYLTSKAVQSPTKTAQEMNNIKKNKVTASKFLNWYFSSSDDVKSLGERAIKMMLDEGFVNISARQLFDETSYIPSFICEGEEMDKEYDPTEVEFIND